MLETATNIVVPAQYVLYLAYICIDESNTELFFLTEAICGINSERKTLARLMDLMNVAPL